MSVAAKRVLLVSVAVVAICAAIGLYIGLYLIHVPGSQAAIQSSSGTQLFLGTVPASETTDPHPSWVSYYVVDANSGNWRHDTTFELPANTVVHVTIYNFDGASGLRNPFISQATGTIGGAITLDNKPTQTVNPDDASHVFAVPAIGLSVPIKGVPDDAKNPCGNAPCGLSYDHTTTTFTFRTPGKGLYRWQCFVPCAAGYIAGFGGPMQAEGYMGGYLKVV